MNFNLKKPCANCPFRTDIKFYLDDNRVDEICHSLIQEQQTFACHKTTHFDDDGEANIVKKTEHCAGAMIMLEKMQRPNQLMRIAERLGGYDHTKLDMDSPVFETDDDMRDEYAIRNHTR